MVQQKRLKKHKNQHNRRILKGKGEKRKSL